jgi:hypothetical protein
VVGGFAQIGRWFSKEENQTLSRIALIGGKHKFGSGSA